MVSNVELLTKATKLESNDKQKVFLPTRDVVFVTHIGSSIISDGHIPDNVLHIPNFKFNLLSISQVIKALQCLVVFFPDFCIFQDLFYRKVKAIGREHDGLYLLPSIPAKTIKSDNRCSLIARHSLVTSTTKTDLSLWHKRLGHPSSKVLRNLVSTSIDDCSSVVKNCCVCPCAKLVRLPFSHISIKTSTCFELLHLDVWDPYKVATYDGNKYFLTIIDDFSRMSWLFLLKFKSDVCVVIRQFLTYVLTQFDKSVRRIRTDNGTKFVNSVCDSLFKSLGIIHQKSYAYTPQQNGVAERKHKHILEVCRAIIFQGHISIKYWGHCVLVAIYLINRMPSPNLRNKSPYELLYGTAPTITHLRVLGCLCFAKDISETDKLKSKATTIVHMGYSHTQKGYILYDLTHHVFFVSRDVDFKEKVFPFKNIKQPGPSPFCNVYSNDLLSTNSSLSHVSHIIESSSPEQEPPQASVSNTYNQTDVSN